MTESRQLPVQLFAGGMVSPAVVAREVERAEADQHGPDRGDAEYKEEFEIGHGINP